MVAAETSGNITRPPNLSVRAPTTIRPREPTITGTATRSATSDSVRSPRVPCSRNSGPSGLSSAQAQKLTANPSVATASISPADLESLLESGRSAVLMATRALHRYRTLPGSGATWYLTVSQQTPPGHSSGA